MTEQRHPIWLDQELARRDVYVVHEEPVQYAYEVMATSEQVVRWQGAWKAWEAAQAEMSALWNQAQEIADTIEKVEEHLEDEEWEKQKQDSLALARMAEAEAEREHGPRQWVLVDLRKETNPGGWKSREVVYARRVHHKDCPVFLKVKAAIDAGESTATYGGLRILGGPDSDYVRTPEAIRWLNEVPLYGEVKIVRCKRCTGPLMDAVAP